MKRHVAHLFGESQIALVFRFEGGNVAFVIGGFLLALFVSLSLFLLAGFGVRFTGVVFRLTLGGSEFEEVVQAFGEGSFVGGLVAQVEREGLFVLLDQAVVGEEHSL